MRDHNVDMGIPPQQSRLEQSLSSALYRRETQSKLRRLKSSPPGAVDFSSNDFLSLATTRQFREDYLQELQNRILPIGSTGSRLLDGNSEYAERLEQRISHFHNAEAGLLVSSGFDANVSIFTCLPQPGDTVVYDELIHASVHDGMRSSRATSFLPFKHNCVDDLKTKLERCVSTGNNNSIFVAVESVYSMDGDLAPLAEMASLIQAVSPQGNCHLIVDEAHATGVFGPKGRGRVSQLGLEKDVLVRLHTFGKAIACNGAVILCSPTIRAYLINYARPIIFSTFMSFPNLTAINVAYDWLTSGKTDILSQQLRTLVQHMHKKLQAVEPALQQVDPGALVLPEACPESAIFALMMREPRELASFCQAAGFVVRAVMHPTVPLGTERVRICLHAGNTRGEIDSLVSTIQTWIQQQTSLTTTQSTTHSIPAKSDHLLPKRKHEEPELEVAFLPSKL